MVTIRWLRLPPGPRVSSPLGGARNTEDLDPWLETLHRLAKRRISERAALVDAGRTLRARLR